MNYNILVIDHTMHLDAKSNFLQRKTLKKYMQPTLLMFPKLSNTKKEKISLLYYLFERIFK
jgi:hypothetical protein